MAFSDYQTPPWLRGSTDYMDKFMQGAQFAQNTLNNARQMAQAQQQMQMQAIQFKQQQDLYPLQMQDALLNHQLTQMQVQNALNDKQDFITGAGAIAEAKRQGTPEAWGDAFEKIPASQKNNPMFLQAFNQANQVFNTQNRIAGQIEIAGISADAKANAARIGAMSREQIAQWNNAQKDKTLSLRADWNKTRADDMAGKLANLNRRTDIAAEALQVKIDSESDFYKKKAFEGEVTMLNKTKQDLVVLQSQPQTPAIANEIAKLNTDVTNLEDKIHTESFVAPKWNLTPPSKTTINAPAFNLSGQPSAAASAQAAMQAVGQQGQQLVTTPTKQYPPSVYLLIDKARSGDTKAQEYLKSKSIGW